MDNSDQQLVDILYENIYIQQIRCDYFNTIGVQSNSIWNKHTDEKKILDNIIEKYKKYYHDKAEEIKNKLSEQKEYNVSSYLTYDTEYYINQYNDRVEELNKYQVELDTKTLDHIATEKLSSISETIDQMFPGYITDPTLLGKLFQL